MGTGVKRPRGEAIHSCPARAEVKNKWSNTYTLPYDFTTYTAITSAAPYIFADQLIQRFAEFT
jgi:hypothetical protein